MDEIDIDPLEENDDAITLAHQLRLSLRRRLPNPSPVEAAVDILEGEKQLFHSIKEWAMRLPLDLSFSELSESAGYYLS